jgi:hypothetical protein
MDVEFREATIPEIADFLTKKDEGLNIVIQQNIQDIRVSLKLRNVTSLQVLNALPFATERSVEIEDLPDGIVGVKGVVPQAFGEDGMPLRPECRIFSLAAYLAGKDEKAGAEAIEQFHRSLNAAVDMLNAASPQSRVKMPQLQVNPETRLLIAVGMRDDLAVVEQLVAALQGNAAAPVYGYRNESARGPMGSPGAGLPGLPGSPPVPGTPIGIPGIAPGEPPGAGNAPRPVPTVPATKR